MKRFLLVLSFVGSINSCVDEDGFTPLERQKIAQSSSYLNRKPTILLPTMSVSFDIIVDGDSVLYDTPVFKLNGEIVACQICGKQPYQIEVTNGKLKCFCFNHIPKKKHIVLE